MKSSPIPASTRRVAVVLLCGLAGCLFTSCKSSPPRQGVLIQNPYEPVDWARDGRHVANFHTHTTGSDDDRWLFMPGLNLVKRVAASDKRTSFVGSDFFYEDVSGRSPDLDIHELVEANDLYYVLKNTPKDPKSVEFASYKVWIHKATFMPVKGEYYDAEGKKFREMQALEVKEIQGFQTVVKSQMNDLRTGSTTTLSYNKVEYNIGLNEDLFTERY